jgi:hypothetical protein
MSHTAMNTAFDQQAAIPLSPSATWLVRYDSAWWVVYERGWLRITDPVTAEDLDQVAARLAEASSAAADHDHGTGDAQRIHNRS